MDFKHVQFKHPCNCLIVGMTGSGKTVLTRELLRHHNILWNTSKQNINILWTYGQWHNLIDVDISENSTVKYVSGLPTETEIENFKPDIVVVDDLLNEMTKDSTFENLFIKKSHHLNISVIFLIQNLFYNAKSMRTISLNCHYIILMKNPRDKTQVTSLARQISPQNMGYFISSYNDATKNAYGYIRIDLTPDTPEEFRLLTDLVPNGKQFPILYVERTK